MTQQTPTHPASGPVQSASQNDAAQSAPFGGGLMIGGKAPSLRPGARLELHLLQSLPPNNLNRDDTGSPKDAIFGGVRRGRVSSQSWKRAMRLHARAQSLLHDGDLASRTKMVPAMIRAELNAAGVASPLADGIAARVVSTLSGKEIGATTDALLLFGTSEARAIAQAVTQNLAAYEDGTPQISLEEAFIEPEAEAESAEAPGKKPKGKGKAKPKEITFKGYPGALAGELGRALGGAPSLDVALHGRMLASNSDYSVDGALQVAHALGTHAAPREFDYLTGLDELKSDPGAAMIEQVEFGSWVLYRYLCLDLNQLSRNLAGMPEAERREATLRAVRSLIESAMLALPSGKQRAFAANALPSYALVGVATRGPAMSLANAFLQPVMPGEGGGYLDASASRLEGEFAALQRVYGRAGTAQWQRLQAMTRQTAAGDEGARPSLEGLPVAVDDVPTLDALIEGAVAQVAALLGQVPAHAEARRG